MSGQMDIIRLMLRDTLSNLDLYGSEVWIIDLCFLTLEYMITNGLNRIRKIVPY
jgi:hypothetical protein